MFKWGFSIFGGTQSHNCLEFKMPRAVLAGVTVRNGEHEEGIALSAGNSDREEQ